jgi:hypothetical protein
MAGIFAEDISVNNLKVNLINGGTYPPDIDGSNWTQSGNDIINKNSGNVGIGTNNPSEKLMVAGRSVSLGIPILLGINNIDNIFSVTSTGGLPANSDIISVGITTVLTTGVSTNSKLLVRADGNCMFNNGVAGFTGNFDSSLKSSNSSIKFTSGSDNFIKTQFFSNGDTVSSQILPFNRVTTIQNTNTTTITTTITLNLGIGFNSQSELKISIRDPIIEVWQIPF